MATYNGAVFLEQQLESIAAQTLPPVELVVCDDGSSDGTVDLVMAFARKVLFPVRLHQNEVRLGFKANFMKAAGLCKGDLIAFCDQDDVWAPEKLKRMIIEFDKTSTVLAYHNSYIIDEHNQWLGLFWQEGQYRFLSDPAIPRLLSPPPGYCIIIRSWLLDYQDLWFQSIDPYKNDERLAHDSWVFLSAAALGDRVLVKEPLASYRQHGRNVYGYQRATLIDRAKTFVSKLASQNGAENRNLSASWYQAQAVATYNWLDILLALRTRVPISNVDRIGNMLQEYKLLGENLTLRAWIYKEDSWLKRVTLFFHLLAKGGYSAGTSSVGRHAVLKDIFILFPKISK
jgi:glycosyltransferase involved in cell wall biosynthesis